MATIALMVGGAITNALAFSGFYFLFSQMSGAEERKRHNLGSVHKYFGGVGWAIENFRHQTFLTPPFQAAKTF